MMFRQLPGAIWTTDHDLRLTYVAGRLAKNVSPRARPGMAIFEILGSHEPTHPVIASHRAALAGESQSLAYKFREYWYAIFIEQLRDDSGQAVGCIAVAYDITEERETKERLARSESLLRQAQRVAHVGSFEWDIKADHITWSEELYRIYGIEPGQFGATYESYLQHADPEDRERVKVVLFDALRERRPFVDEHRIVRPDGTKRVLHTRGDVITDANNQPVCVAGCCWDTTELKEATDNVKRARSLLEATIDATADGILVVDTSARVTKYNQRFLALWRVPDALARQHNDEKLLAYVCDQLESPDEFLCGIRSLYNDPERDSFDVLHFKDGRVFERYSIPQRIGHEIVGRVWSFRDVTEREKLLRRALFLADATRLLVSLDVEPALDSVAHLAVPYLGDVCAIDLLGNGHPRRLIVVGREDIKSFSPDLQSSVLTGHSAIYSAGARSCMAVPLVVKGAVAGAITLVAPARRNYGGEDLEFAETLASRAALSVENGRLYREAQEALHARDEFLAVAAHEIRGPITSVHMAVQGLQRGKLPASAEPKVLEIIEREDRRLARFVDELLDLGRIQSGQIYFNFEEVDLGELVREAITELKPELTKSGSSLSINSTGNPVGEWDRFRLQQVATNLLSNAIKFGEGKPIAVHVSGREGTTTFSVQDHGIGIAPEKLDEIFKPFERGVSSRHYAGLGLGLFIVRTIVEGLGGTIRVQSRPKMGSTFTIELQNSRRVHEPQ